MKSNGKSIFAVILAFALILVFTFNVPGATGEPEKSDTGELLKKLEALPEGRERVKVLLKLYFVFNDSDIKTAMQYARQALELSKKIDYPKGEVNSLHNIGRTYAMQGDYNQALDILSRNLALAEKIGEKKGAANSSSIIAVIFKRKGDYPKALEYNTRALNLYQEIHDEKGMAISYNNIGNILTKQGKGDQALGYFTKCLEISRRLGDKRKIAASLTNIGNYHSLRADHSRALEYYLKSLEIAEDMGNKRFIAYNYRNIGSIYLGQDNNEKALEYFNKALDVRKKLNDKAGIADTYVQIGNIQLRQGDTKAGLESFLKSKKINRELGLKSNLAISYFSIASVYNGEKQYREALDYFSRALKIAREIDAKPQIAKANQGIAACYMDMAEYSKAIDYSGRALTIARDFDYQDVVEDAYHLLSVAYAKTGQYKQAYQNHVLFKQNHDKLSSKANTEKITQLEMNYRFQKEKKLIAAEQHRIDLERETEIKKQSFLRHVYLSGFLFMTILSVLIYRSFRTKKRNNALLAQQQDEIIRQSIELELANRELEELNATKDKFFSIIAHDLRNPFSSLMGLLKMIVLDFEKLDNKDIKDLLGSIHGASQKTYTLLENLLHWSRSQTGALQMNPRTLELKKTVEHSIQLLRHHALSKGIRLENDIQEDAAVVADEYMIKTVFRNLISNAIKFTPPGGRVRTMVRQANGQIEAEVSDTGVGIDKENIDKLFRIDTHFSREGTANEQGTGLGLILCKEFIERNGGTISVESEPGKGSTFILSIPSA